MENSIGNRITHYRKLRGLTQAEAADALGISRNTYNRMEIQGNPRQDMLEKLAALFKVSTETIVHGDSVGFDTENALILSQPNDEKDGNVNIPFIASEGEKNIIKVFRLLPQKSKEDVLKYIEEAYLASKNQET